MRALEEAAASALPGLVTLESKRRNAGGRRFSKTGEVSAAAPAQMSLFEEMVSALQAREKPPVADRRTARERSRGRQEKLGKRTISKECTEGQDGVSDVPKAKRWRKVLAGL